MAQGFLLVLGSLAGSVGAADPAAAAVWEQPRTLTQGERACLSPAVLITRSGTMWVFYQGGDPEDFNTHELYCKRLAQGQWSEEMRLTENRYGDFNPSACQAQDGTIWLFWGTGRGNNYDTYEIQYRTFDGQQWSDPKPLTANRVGDFSPSAVWTRKGELWVFWIRGQGYDFSSYEVYYRTLTGPTWSEEHRLTHDEAIDFNPEVMEDRQGRLWLVRSAQQRGQLNVFCQSLARGQWQSHGHVTQAQPGGHFNPHLVQDRTGRFWMTWDVCTEDMASFEVYFATSQDGARWSAGQPLTHSGWSRDAALGLDGQGRLWAFWTQDGADRPQIYYTRLKRDT
jgi:hypothetical protein